MRLSKGWKIVIKHFILQGIYLWQNKIITRELEIYCKASVKRAIDY